MKIWFGTNNKEKVKEVKAILAYFKINTEHLPFSKIEIQANTLEEIARYSLEKMEFNKPLAIEDSGLFIENLKGFPGPYSHYVLDTIHLAGVLKLLEGSKNRKANFQSVIAFRNGSTITVFKGSTTGAIAFEARGSNGFGYDPIFIPDDEPSNQTFGELPTNIKNDFSHRAKSFRSLGEWLTTNY